MCLVKNPISEAKIALIYVTITVEMNVSHVQLSHQTFEPFSFPLSAVYDCFHLVYLLLRSVRLTFCPPGHQEYDGDRAGQGFLPGRGGI